MKKNKFFDIFKIVVSIILIIVSALIFLTAEQQKRARGETICDVGAFLKDENSPFEYNGSIVVTSVGVKAGTGCTFFRTNGQDDCFQVSGIGTSSVRVTQVRSGGECRGISHVSFFSTQQTTPTHSPTPRPSFTPTPTTPGKPNETPSPTLTPTRTETPSPSETPIPTNTPTKTQTPTPSNTATPTLTPTETPLPTDTPQPTDQPTHTPTRTRTPTRTLTPNPSATITSPPESENTPTEIILAETTEEPSEEQTSDLPTVGTVTGWLIVTVPLALVILAFIF